MPDTGTILAMLDRFDGARLEAGTAA